MPPRKFALMLLTNKEAYKELNKHKNSLGPIKFYMEQDFRDGIAPQHISVCYFSFDENEPKVRDIEDELRMLLEPHLPITLEATGIRVAKELGVPALVWKIASYGPIEDIRKEVFSRYAECFPHLAEEEWIPHIGLALGTEQNKAVVFEKPILITLDRAWIYYPSGPSPLIE